jgi:PAS domain S-box-containing protein
MSPNAGVETRGPQRHHIAAAALTFSALVLLAAVTQQRYGQALLPHAFCLSTSPSLQAIHVVSDSLIALAYLLIPWAMLRFVRRRPDIPFGWVAWVFGAFIVACGSTHVLDVLTLYYPAYWYSAVAKAFTAVVSLATAWLLYRITPHMLKVPSIEQFETANRLLRETQDELQALLSHATRRAENERSQFQALADNIAQLAWMTDAQGWIYWYNQRWFEYTGTTMAQMEGWGWQAVHHPDHLERVTQKFKHHLQTGEPWEDTFPLRGADGRYRWFLSRAFPLRDATGKIVRWFGTNTDITEQIEAQAELRDTDRRKDEFIATLAHELRNPLAPIRTSAEILKRYTAEDPKAGPLVDIISRQTQNLSKLTNDLLDVAQISRHRLSLDIVPLDLGELTRLTVEDYRTSMEDQGIALRLEIEGAVPVLGDRVRLNQALGNLLQNAQRHAPNSTVVVKAFADASAREGVVRVEDNGAGIRADLLPRLFQPFEQEVQDGARSKGGLGLGLSVVKGLVELHGGRVAVYSEGPGRGAAFEFRLPLVVG